jgi:hypothetical protein
LENVIVKTYFDTFSTTTFSISKIFYSKRAYYVDRKIEKIEPKFIDIYLFVNTLVAQLYVEQHADKKVKSKGFRPE